MDDHDAKQCVIRLSGRVSFRDAVAVEGKVAQALRLYDSVGLDFSEAEPLDQTTRGFLDFLASLESRRIHVLRRPATV